MTASMSLPFYTYPLASKHVCLTDRKHTSQCHFFIEESLVWSSSFPGIGKAPSSTHVEHLPSFWCWAAVRSLFFRSWEKTLFINDHQGVSEATRNSSFNGTEVWPAVPNLQPYIYEPYIYEAFVRCALDSDQFWCGQDEVLLANKLESEWILWSMFLLQPKDPVGHIMGA